MRTLIGILVIFSFLQLTLCEDLEDEINSLEEIIPGRAGFDYPLHNDFPPTDFRCSDYNYAGFFADTDLGCQGYHICFPDGRNASFLCINGTLFNQRYFVCDWWFNFDCSVAPRLYVLNLFKKPALPDLPPITRKIFIRPRKRKPTEKPRPLAVRQADECYCPCLNETFTYDLPEDNMQSNQTV